MSAPLPPITIRCLGTFEVIIGTTSISTFPTDKARALLVYLALEAQGMEEVRPHRRELLAGLLWPEMSDAHALTNLRLTIHRLRQTLDRIASGISETLIESTRHTIRFNPAVVNIDVNTFQILLATCATHVHSNVYHCEECIARLSQAVDLYKGELLVGFGLPDALVFEEWLQVKREQVQRQVLTALATLAEHHLRAGHVIEASDAARRQIALNPWHEAAHRQLMRALAEAGDRVAALLAFEHCRQLLQHDLGVEPDGETLILAAQIRDANSVPSIGLPLLPTPLTPLIGREHELAQVEMLMRMGDTRLVTIVGVGGAGKTRLALAAAWSLADLFADGVWWVPLGGVTATESLLQYDALAAAVGAVLGCPFGGKGAPLDEVRDYLRERAGVLVLDNCEHLSASAPFIRELLEAAPQLRVLATSRVMLDLPGEVPLRLDGLPVPTRDADDPASYAGVQLFLERARQHLPNLDDSPVTLAAMGRLCRLLDGLPLGIELAARWVGHYTCDEIAGEIQADLDFLTLPKADVPERQRGLQAAFDYSWRLLKPAERLTLARLSVFRGTFDRTAAHMVAGTRPGALAALVDASLVRNLGVGQYGFHELVRQFAAARLAESGKMEMLIERHATYYLDVLAQQEAALYGNTPQTGAVIIRDAADNIRQAWIWAVDHDAWHLIGQSLPALRQYARIDGLFHEYAARVAAAAKRLGAQIATGVATPKQVLLLGRLRGTEAYFLERQERRSAATTAARAAIASATQASDALGEAYGYLQLSSATVPYIAALASQQTLPAIGWLERAITLCRTARDSESAEQRYANEIEADSLLHLSTIRIDLREYDAACALAEQALALTRVNGDSFQEARALSFSAAALENAGRYEVAYERRMAMLAQAQINGSHYQEHIALNNLSCTLIYLGDYSAALEYARAALRVLGEWVQNPYENADSYHTLSWAACRAGETRLALEIAQQALAFALATHVPQYQMLPLLALGDALYELDRYSEAHDAFAAALALGQKQQMPPLVAVALAGIARCRFAQGAYVDAQTAVDTLLASQDILTLGSLWEPLRVAETCYHVLAAIGDARAATLLQAAVALLQQQTNAIANPSRQRIFREHVPAHRALLEAAAQSAMMV